MNCSMVYCFDGRSLFSSDKAAGVATDQEAARASRASVKGCFMPVSILRGLVWVEGAGPESD